MPLKKESDTGTIFLHTLFSLRYFLLVIIVTTAFLYVFGIREQLTIAQCHNLAETIGRERMKMRAQQNPENTQIVQVASAGLYANEDYAPAYRNCMLRKGYEPELP